MTRKRLDITGPVSPFCMLTVERKAKALLPSDELIVTCDNCPAVTTIIPRIAGEQQLSADTRRVAQDTWEITLRKRS